VYEDDVDMVVAPASEGYVGILPHHVPLFTTLGPGEFKVKKGGVEEVLAVFGGFMDVRADKVGSSLLNEVEGAAVDSSPRTVPSAETIMPMLIKSMNHAKKRVTGPASVCENTMPSGVLMTRALAFIVRISPGTGTAKPIQWRRKRSLRRTERLVRDIARGMLPPARPIPAAVQIRNSA